MAILSKYNIEKYQFDIDVRKRHQLYGMSGKLIYEGKWISRRDDPIIIVEMNETIAEREARFYLELNSHHNIIHTLGYVENSLNLTIFIQEFAQLTDLAGVLMDNQFIISQTILIEMFLQIADAMSYITSKKIVHGDLGCRNVLVFQLDPSQTKNNLVKITDFGLARWIDQPSSHQDQLVIPIRYCAPEILQNNRHEEYSEKSDVYSMGVLIWEALSNSEIPYSSIPKDDDVKQMKLNNEKLQKPHTCDHQLWTLMNNCWNNNPRDRPSFELIKQRLSNMKVSDNRDLRSFVSFHEPPAHYEYELDIDIEMHDLLNGQFGKTYEAEWISREERPIVLIVMDKEPSEYEALVYTNFNPHHHILYTFGFVENNRGLILLLQERALHGNLQVLLNNRQFQPLPIVLITIFLQIVEAMIYVISKDIVHGNLCCANVLVFQMHPSESTENLVKLTNFSLAHKNDPSFVDDRRLPIPVRYCAPEILRSAGRSNYSELSDVYSMGVLMWEACSNGKLPYESLKTNSEIRQRKLNGEKLSKPFMCDRQIWSIIEDCWHNEPQLRYNFKDMKKRFFNVRRDSIETSQYELNVNVKQRRPLNGNNGKFYEADWIPKKDPPIILIVMDEEIAEQEALFYMKFNSHPHIVHTFGFVKNDLKLTMLLQERALYGDLQTLLQNEKFQPSGEVLVAIFLQIIDAMIYITSQGIVHGDLRCINVLVFEMNSSDSRRNLVKLTNFRMSCEKDQSVSIKRVPQNLIQYCAPEIHRNQDRSNYSELSDVYSMGVLMWQACSKGAIPNGSHTSDDDIQQRKSNEDELSKPKECDSRLWSVIKYCWYNEPSLRLSFEQLKIQLLKIDFNIIDRIRCHLCNNEIPENEIDNHQKSCLPKHISPEKRVHFTRCNYCGERCLGSQLEEHQQACTLKPQPILGARCNYCGNEYQNNEIVDHQKSCPSRSEPPVSRSQKLVLQKDISNHRRQYPIPEIKKNERSRSPKSETDTQQSLKSVPHSNCKYCHGEYPSININNHEQSCSSRPTSQRSKPATVSCRYCNEKFLLHTIEAHEVWET
ncbi:unnamed protein product [Rotaria sordida]|uniref:Protein kinase domain-containing protein n=1 Tax=Rotaria sordida TaxID=392033 RepID=A0A818UXQ0_9BILA|nr:unnamed protein product [Rotaria sordida]